MTDALFDLSDVDLSFAQTVPCTLAHRRALGEVFVADSVETDRDEVVLALQVPRAHSLWYDRRIPCHDPFSMGEAARQATFVVIHRHLGIPRELPFTLQRFALRVLDLDAFHDDGATPLEGLLRYRVTNRNGLSTRVGVLGVRGELVLRGRRAMTVEADVVAMPGDEYEVLRAFQRSTRPAGTGVPGSGAETSTLPPARVGRHDERNVVIGERVGERYPLVLDQRHPSFFDHAYDHLPGPVAVEGLRQAAIAAAADSGALPSPVAVVSSCALEFTAFGYLDHPIEAAAEVLAVDEHGAVDVAVAMYQFDKSIIEGKLSLVPYRVAG